MVEPKLARAYGTLAGFGFIGVALLALPSTRLLEPQPAPEAYLLTLAGLVTGLICLAIPWDWLDPRWLHLAGAVATAEAAATVAVFGLPYVAFYFMIAVLVAYVAPDPRTIAFQLGLVLVALFGPVVYGPEDPRTSLAVGLVVAPVLLLTAGLFAYLRQKMVHDRRAYHRFAEQTLVLSSRIAGRQLGPLGLVPAQETMPRFAWARPPIRWVMAATVVLGLPLLAGSLAVAGVKLPTVAAGPFERVGIELPNQEADDLQPLRAAAAPRAQNAEREATGDQTDGSRVLRSEQVGAGGVSIPARDEPAPGTATDAGQTAPATSSSSSGARPAQPETTIGTAEKEGSPLGELFDDASQGLEGLRGDGIVAQKEAAAG